MLIKILYEIMNMIEELQPLLIKNWLYLYCIEHK